MSNLQSTAPAAHAYLVTNIATALGIQTFNRSALGTNLNDDLCVVGKIDNLEQTWAGPNGASRKDERYDIHVMVRALNGDDPTELDVEALATTAWGYVQGVVELLATDYSLGGAVVYAEITHADEMDPAQVKGGVEIAVEFVITCIAQVTL